MAPIYSGSLPPKKKVELQEIALALRISDQGTKEELVQRITKHLDFNQTSLEDNPTFTGLFTRKKRSVQPQPIPSSRLAQPSTSDVLEKPRSSIRRSTALDSFRESTSTKDLRDVVSTSLKPPLSPTVSPSRKVDVIKSHIPSSLPPSPSKKIIELLPKTPEVKAIVQQLRQQDILQNGIELLTSLRQFLSNSRNIWSVSVVLELVFIMWTIIPWEQVQIPLMSKGQGNVQLTINYPPLLVFKTSAFWLVLLHWALPTAIIPALIGCLITFNPTLKKSHLNKIPVAPLDPLTASIIRLVAQIAYPYTSMASKSDIVGLDVLGPNWRILDAAMGLAFAFAESIAGAPQVLADTIVKEERRLVQRTHTDYDDTEDVVFSGRRAIAATEEESSNEVD